MNMEASAILDLLCAYVDHEQRALGAVYRCTKFGWDQWSSFYNMRVFRLRQYGLKMLTFTPKLRFLGLTPKYGGISTKLPKGYIL